MADLLPHILPTELQDAALAEFDILRSKDLTTAQVFKDPKLQGFSAALSWFRNIVSVDMNNEVNKERLKYWSVLKGSEYTGDATDLHIDSDMVVSTRYLLTLCTIPFASTLYFGTTDAKKAKQYHSHELFSRNEQGILVKNALYSSIAGLHHFQGVNGQVSKFAFKEDIHAASPLPVGAKKIVLSYNPYNPS